MPWRYPHQPGVDQFLVLAKSIDLSWKTTRAVLMLDRGVNAAEYVDRYKKLRLETARSAIQFYRLRERATKALPDNERARLSGRHLCRALPSRRSSDPSEH